MPWTVYILECADKTFYTGMTNDMQSRFAKHSKGCGAKYTRGRGPLKIVYNELHKTKSSALKSEAAIKALRRAQKLELIQHSGCIFLRGKAPRNN
jgi:putative endonuclease